MASSSSLFPPRDKSPKKTEPSSTPQLVSLEDEMRGRSTADIIEESEFLLQDSNKRVHRIHEKTQASIAIGTTTLAKVHHQGEQLAQIDTVVSKIGDDLTEGERQLTSMTLLGALRNRLFGRRSSSSHKEPAPATSSSSKGRERTKSKIVRPSTSTHSGADISHLSPEAQQTDRDTTATLDKIETDLDQLHQIALDMGTALEKQNQRVPRTSQEVTGATKRIETDTRRTQRKM